MLYTHHPRKPVYHLASPRGTLCKLERAGAMRTQEVAEAPPPGKRLCQLCAKERPASPPALPLVAPSSGPRAVIYTDGAAIPNPGRGGWGCVLALDGQVRELSGGEAHTTNQRMELTAALQALAWLPAGCRVALHSDSRYLVDGMTAWVRNWKKHGWKKSPNAAEQVKNVDLWRALDAESARHSVEWKWVRGHSGVPGNERADALATRGLNEAFERESDADAPWDRLAAF